MQQVSGTLLPYRCMRFFRRVDGQGRGLAIGLLYDPSGQNELAPLDDCGRQNLAAVNIDFRAEGGWQTA